jgi:hypothetical protein
MEFLAQEFEQGGINFCHSFTLHPVPAIRDSHVEMNPDQVRSRLA